MSLPRDNSMSAFCGEADALAPSGTICLKEGSDRFATAEFETAMSRRRRASVPARFTAFDYAPLKSKISNNVHRLMYDRKQAELFRQFDRARFCVDALLAHKLTPGPCGSARALLQGTTTEDLQMMQ
ncbi:hypothetical protein ABBQ38_008022 [Trebouxia sp. C0009 RCD-2024]